MTDIVEWLRGHSPTLRIAMRLDEAANEIERLREALSEAIDGESNAGSQVWLDKIYPLLGDKE